MDRNIHRVQYREVAGTVKRMLVWALGALIIAAALAVVIRRVVRFIRSRGQSGCESCPWSGCPRCRR